MMDYVTHENIQRFQKMLAGELDPDKRLLVQGLLAEQKAKLAGADPSPSDDEG